MHDMRTIHLGRRSKVLHVEAPGCIVNIHPALTDSEGRQVTRISVSCDRYAGEPPWIADTVFDADGAAVRVIQQKGKAA